MQHVRFKTGDLVLAEGEEGDSAYLILNGSVEVVIGEGDKARVVAQFGPGDVFGEMSLIEPGPRSASVRAASDLECAVTSYDDFMTSMREHPEQAVEFMKVLVTRLRRMNEMVSSLDPEKRSLMHVFRDWLMPLDESGGEPSDEERERRLAAMMCGVPYI